MWLKNSIRLWILMCLMGLVCQPILAHNQKPITSYADAVAKVADAVVSIYTTKLIPVEKHPMFQDPFFKYFFGSPQSDHYLERQPSLGSGVIIDTKGYILTNNHVIVDANTIEIALNDGRTTQATVVGTDPESDLAVLKINLKNLPEAKLGSTIAKRVGDVVLAIGNPFGVGQTVTQGIISALGREQVGLSLYESYIQTDAAINPGNSGGALIDTDGNVIGINTAIFSQSGGNQGIGFAIPIEYAQEIMHEIINSGQVMRAWMGVTLQTLTPEIKREMRFPHKDGVLIAGVVIGGPAFKAGLRNGDIVTKINTTKISSPHQMLRMIAKMPLGIEHKVEFYRHGRKLNALMVLKTQPLN